jgi:hypothetical protein
MIIRILTYYATSKMQEHSSDIFVAIKTEGVIEEHSSDIFY